MGTKAATKPAEDKQESKPNEVTKATTSPTSPMIHGKIVELMKEVGAITKGKTANGYKFRGIDDILENLFPALTKLGLTLETEIVSHSTDRYQEDKPGSNSQKRTINTATVHHRIRIYAEDGSYRTFESVADGLDYGSDKAPSKAMSASYKYAMTLGLCLPTRDLEDNDQVGSGKVAGDGNGHGGPSLNAPTPGPIVPSASNTPTPTPPPTTAIAPPHNVAGTLTQPTNPTDGMSEVDDAPASKERIDELLALASKLEMPADELNQAIAKRGVSKVNELTTKQIKEMIGNLKKYEMQVQADETFQPGPS